MSSWCKCGQSRVPLAKGLARCIMGALLLLVPAACDRPVSAATPVSPGLAHMEREVLKLSARVNLLESQLQQERYRAAQARQAASEQAARLAALENQAGASIGTSPAANPASTLQLEAELRLAYRSLMRAIERLDISADEKAALKNSLRPSRALDPVNPWSVAQH